MVLSSLVELGMLIIARASAVEAVETNIETSRVILGVVINIKAMRFVGIALLDKTSLTIESKHCVQSSRYTASFGPGGLNATLYVSMYAYQWCNSLKVIYL